MKVAAQIEMVRLTPAPIHVVYSRTPLPLIQSTSIFIAELVQELAVLDAAVFF